MSTKNNNQVVICISKDVILNTYATINKLYLARLLIATLQICLTFNIPLLSLKNIVMHINCNEINID